MFDLISVIITISISTHTLGQTMSHVNTHGHLQVQCTRCNTDVKCVATATAHLVCRLDELQGLPDLLIILEKVNQPS